METSSASAAPRLTIIIPARNEESNLERCLRSLVVQRGVPFQIVIVDDASTDRTREIAESFTRARQCPFIAMNTDLLDVQVIDAPPLPAGWSGKVNALVAGEAVAYSVAHTEWLLFTDADTEHLPGSLAAAVAEAQQHGVALLSYSPEQELKGIRQNLVMPVILASWHRSIRRSGSTVPHCRMPPPTGNTSLSARRFIASSAAGPRSPPNCLKMWRWRGDTS